MFNIGDKVVYPMHGAGVIESIEEKEILGQKQKYYKNECNAFSNNTHLILQIVLENWEYFIKIRQNKQAVIFSIS